MVQNGYRRQPRFVENRLARYQVFFDVSHAADPPGASARPQGFYRNRQGDELGSFSRSAVRGFVRTRRRERSQQGTVCRRNATRKTNAPAYFKLKLMLTCTRVAVGWPSSRAGSYFQFRSASSAAALRIAGPEITFMSRTWPDSFTSALITTVPCTPSMRATCG